VKSRLWPWTKWSCCTDQGRRPDPATSPGLSNLAPAFTAKNTGLWGKMVCASIRGPCVSCLIPGRQPSPAGDCPWGSGLPSLGLPWGHQSLQDGAHPPYTFEAGPTHTQASCSISAYVSLSLTSVSLPLSLCLSLSLSVCVSLSPCVSISL
jgi:hypothetical protein